MDKFHLHWYTDEVQIHAASAIASYKHLQSLVAEKNTRQSREVWFALVSFLTHAAMVSKFFDPITTDEQKKQRGEDLRAHLKIAEDSPILPRTARDNLEHFDERIDNWVKNEEYKILEMVFDDRDGFNFINEPKGAIRRVLIAKEMVFISENRKGYPEETRLSPVFEALQSLQDVCLHKLATESPYSYRLAQALRNYER